MRGGVVGDSDGATSGGWAVTEEVRVTKTGQGSTRRGSRHRTAGLDTQEAQSSGTDRLRQARSGAACDAADERDEREQAHGELCSRLLPAEELL